MVGDELKPGFFIVGAPRCGTTTLSRYLSRHPEICFSKPKEPHFFARPSLNLDKASLQSQYIEPFFAHHDACRHKLLGEGSVSYLYSRRAIENILEVNPEAKFIVSVRNPIDMIQSYHSRLLYTLDESEKDFTRAWSLQAERAAGRSIPAKCREPGLLQYAEIGSLGRNVERLLRIAGRERCKIVVFDDFAKWPKLTYRQVVEFLGLETYEQPRISTRRKNRDYRSSLIQRVQVRPPKSLLAMLGVVEWATGAKGLKKHLRSEMKRINSVRVARPVLDDSMKSSLVETFAEDIELLSRLLKRDLTHWTEPHSGAG
jgi:hypothetical protein